MTRGDRFDGAPCGRCTSTVRSVQSGRCLACARRWQAQSKDTADERAVMVCQPCMICAEPMEHPQYDELDGTFRGWLCQGCNLGLGHFRDNAARILAAARYARTGNSATDSDRPQGYPQATASSVVHLVR